MSAVVAVEAKGDKAAILIMGDGSRVWTPERAKAEGLVGKPIPADWTQKQGEYGPQAFPPREGKGGGKRGGGFDASYRNTEDGFKYERDRIDRGKALDAAPRDLNGYVNLEQAELIYAWLRAPLESVSAPGRVGSGTSEAVAAPAKEPGGETVKTGRVGADTPSDGGDGTEYPQVGSGKPPSASATPSPSSTTVEAGVEAGQGHSGAGLQPSAHEPKRPASTTHAEKWSPYGNPEKCAHQLVPGIKGWLKCTKCGSAKKEAEWA